MGLEKLIVIDGRAHLFGRLASVVAKQLLSGENIVVVRAEQMMVSGSLVRNKVKYAQYRHKRTNTNPMRGPYHFRSPSKMFTKAVKGMVPRTKERGRRALQRLRVYEGVPCPFDTKKKMVVPQALKVLKLAPGRRFCVLGELASHVGWKHADIVKTNEVKRKEKSAKFYEKKLKTQKLLKEATEKAQPSYADVKPLLEKYGY